MKFAHEYRLALQQGDFPTQWIDSAISYKELKACIRKIRLELSSLGLGLETVSNLVISEAPTDCVLASLQYGFKGDLTLLEPVLTCIVDGKPYDPPVLPLRLPQIIYNSNEKSLADEKLNTFWLPPDLLPLLRSPSAPVRLIRTSSYNAPHSNPEGATLSSTLEKFTVPLKSDVRFFKVLTGDLEALDALHEETETNLKEDITCLGQAVALHTSKKGQASMQAWREVFRLYIDCNIFFSSLEQEPHRTPPMAVQERLKTFSLRLHETGLLYKIDKKGPHSVLNRFLRINLTLLRHLQYQELNKVAMTKILKKFEKQTALQSRPTFRSLLDSKSIASSKTAQAMCYELSERVLAVVPQLSDYLCPVCLNVAYKPIKLECGHIYCIRCMVVMQRANEDHCPLCRSEVVMQADSGNLDSRLMEFLEGHFPKEVKAKQRENQRAAAIDRYGPSYDQTKCCVM